MPLKNRPAYSHVTVSSSPLLQCVFDNEKTTIKNWKTYKLNHFARPIDIYLQFINSLSKDGRRCVELTNRSVVVQSRDEMRMACAFVLASNHRWHFKCTQGKIHLMAGLKGDIDESMLLDIQKWYHAQADELTYEFLLSSKRLPETFVEHIIKPYLKRMCITINASPIPSHSCNERRQPFLSSPRAEESSTEGSDEQYMPSESRLLHPDRLANHVTLNSDTVRLADESRKLDELINNTLTKFNIKSTSRKPIENSVTAKRLMEVKHALLNRNQPDDEHESSADIANAIASCDRSLTAETQTDSRSLPSATADINTLVQQEACTTLKQVSTEAFLNDVDRQYIFRKTLKTRRHVVKKVRQFLDVITQWLSRNKRRIVFHLTDFGVGLAVNILLSTLISLAIGSAFILSSAFIFTVFGAIIFWFVVHNILCFVKTKWHSNQSEKLHEKISKLEADICIYCEKIETMSKQLQSKMIKSDRVAELEAVLAEHLAILQQTEITLQQHKHKLLKSLMFLSGHKNITDALIKERRELDALAKKVSELKHTASDSFENAVSYETAMAELKSQQILLEKAMKPVIESSILALEVYTQDKASIEKDIRTLLGSGQGEINLFEEMNDENIGQLFSTVIDNKGEQDPPSKCRAIWSFLYKPRLIEGVMNHDFQKSMYNKEKLLGRQCERARKIGPEQYKEVEIEGNLVDRNPNIHVANLLLRAQTGIQTKQVIDEQMQKLETQIVSRGIKGACKVMIGYVIFHLKRIPYRLYEAGVMLALLSGVKPGLGKLLGSTFASQATASIFGVVAWTTVSYIGQVFNSWNNQINKAMAAVREHHMTNYSDPYSLDDIPDWMALKESNISDAQGHPIIRTREQMGYFNAGVIDDNLVQSLTENEWRSLRRRAKFAFSDAAPLINELQDVKLKLSTLTNQLSQEHLAAKSEGLKMVHDTASRKEVVRLLLCHNLLVHRIEKANKIVQQANYECVRHVNRINHRLKIKHTQRHVTVC